MSIKEQISEKIKIAMKNRRQTEVDTLRMVMAAIKNKEKERKTEIDDSAVTSLIATLIKQRREAAELYRKGNRVDLADKEESEILILQEYQPEKMPKEILIEIIDDCILEVNASSAGDMGKVMKAVMPKIGGRAEGREVNALVKERLLSRQ